MQIIKTLKELKNWRDGAKDKSLVFVPTMGALHEGHKALIQRANQEGGLTIVSIFVNPLQFAPTEDLSKYPRTLEADLELCKTNGVAAVFMPTFEELYPNGMQNLVKIVPPLDLANCLADCLCGASRPGHFEGVLTVVAKLFNLVQPSKACFGEKDFQQLVLIKRMVSDLNFNLEIIPVPTVRETSESFKGLALSSRNRYLSEEQKILATEIYATLCKARELILSGEPVAKVIKDLTKDYFEYFEARDPESLQLSERLPLRLFVAVRIGSTRLIDNLAVAEN
ncbi:MAG: pantoate--beta-alanine ligase [Candidatus Caenarcaniphilales bacterium]|nr:pantoate--beta-alanine ligase [Candidatus Caenarcaniphilales bacterium]